jgi:hypothetical protein
LNAKGLLVERSGAYRVNHDKSLISTSNQQVVSIQSLGDNLTIPHQWLFLKPPALLVRHKIRKPDIFKNLLLLFHGKVALMQFVGNYSCLHSYWLYLVGKRKWTFKGFFFFCVMTIYNLKPWCCTKLAVLHRSSAVRQTKLGQINNKINTSYAIIKSTNFYLKIGQNIKICKFQVKIAFFA